TKNYLVRQDYWMVSYLVGLYERQAAGKGLDLSEKRAIERYEAKFDAGATNLRWQLLDQQGGVLYGNTQEDSGEVDVDYLVEYPRGEVVDEVNVGWNYLNEDTMTGAVNWEEYSGVRYDDNWRDLLPAMVEASRNQETSTGGIQMDMPDGDAIEVGLDTALADEDGLTKILRIISGHMQYAYVPTIRACLKGNQFGYIFDPEGLSWQLTPEAQAEQEGNTANLVLWVDDALRVDDQYRKAALKLEEWQASRTQYLAGTIVLGVLGVLLTVYLCCATGPMRGSPGMMSLLFIGGWGEFRM
ncbi:MAG: hypothetical protein K1W21_00905, partial [Oscillospiraceae bacterium]